MSEKENFAYLAIKFCGCLFVATLIIGIGFGQFKIKTPTEAEGHIYRVSAFCPNSCCCGKWADGYTASGHKIRKGDKFCAAPPEIPFGTMLEIPGYGRVPVLDRGGAIKSRRLDVFFGFDPNSPCDPHQKALEWGVRYLRVKIIKD